MNENKILVLRDTNPVTERTMTWVVRVVQTGDKYGRNMCLTNTSGKPYVEFYDTHYVREDCGDFGYFVARYYKSTIMEHEDIGLCLDGGAAACNVSADGMRRVKRWLGGSV